MTESASPVRDVAPPSRWDVAAEYTAAETNTELKAAPGVGLALYITDLYIAAKGAVDITLKSGTSTLKFKYYADAAGAGVSKEYKQPMKLGENEALTVTTSAAVNVTVSANGYLGAP